MKGGLPVAEEFPPHEPTLHKDEVSGNERARLDASHDVFGLVRRSRVIEFLKNLCII